MAAQAAFTISPEGLEFLRKHEGVRYQVYDDRTGSTVSSYEAVQGYPTIGIGHLITNAEKERFRPYLGSSGSSGGASLSHAEVMALFASDVANKFEKILRPRITGRINQKMWDALIIQSFNTGPNTNAIKTTIAHINNGNYDQSVLSFQTRPVTSKGKVLSGLVKRRDEEVKLYGTGVFELKRQMLDEQQSGSNKEEIAPQRTNTTPVWVIASAGVSAATLFLLAMLRIRKRLRQP